MIARFHDTQITRVLGLLGFDTSIYTEVQKSA